MSEISNNYSEYSAQELRDMLLNNILQEDLMCLEDYEKLLDYEMNRTHPFSVVLYFCSDGLSRFDEYDIDVTLPPLEKIIKNVNKKVKKFNYIAKKTQRTKRLLIAVVIAVSTLIIGAVTAAAFGYNIIDSVGRVFVNIFAEKTAIVYKGMDVNRTDDTRFYTSMDEMIKAENLSILYPEKLPDNYSFTGFQVIAHDTYLAVYAYSSEPYITFEVEIETSQVDPNHYSHEANGIEYTVDKIPNGKYLAWFFYEGDYYSIVAGDAASLSEVINNLKGS